MFTSSGSNENLIFPKKNALSSLKSSGMVAAFSPTCLLLVLEVGYVSLLLIAISKQFSLSLLQNNQQTNKCLSDFQPSPSPSASCSYLLTQSCFLHFLKILASGSLSFSAMTLNLLHHTQKNQFKLN